MIFPSELLVLKSLEVTSKPRSTSISTIIAVNTSQVAKPFQLDFIGTFSFSLSLPAPRVLICSNVSEKTVSAGDWMEPNEEFENICPIVKRPTPIQWRNQLWNSWKFVLAARLTLLLSTRSSIAIKLTLTKCLGLSLLKTCALAGTACHLSKETSSLFYIILMSQLIIPPSCSTVAYIVLFAIDEVAPNNIVHLQLKNGFTEVTPLALSL